MIMLNELGTSYELKLVVKDSFGHIVTDDIVKAVIQDISSQKYFNGLFWIEQEAEIIIPHKVNGEYAMMFKPDYASSFKLTISSQQHNLSESQVVQFYAGDIIPDGVTPVKIDQSNFKNQDGTDTTILDINGKPLVGVKISCYNKDTKEVVAVSQSNDFGEWAMIIPEGYYFFVFEKDGYLSISFERTVTASCL